METPENIGNYKDKHLELKLTITFNQAQVFIF